MDAGGIPPRSSMRLMLRTTWLDLILSVPFLSQLCAVGDLVDQQRYGISKHDLVESDHFGEFPSESYCMLPIPRVSVFYVYRIPIVD